MGETTVGRIVKETVEILWEELHPLHMPLPTTESLKNNANEFENIWNFPHVVGCLDSKHIRIVCPTDSDAMFFKYKKHFSVVGTAVAQWLCCCATNRKVASSIPAGVIGIFH